MTVQKNPMVLPVRCRRSFRTNAQEPAMAPERSDAPGIIVEAVLYTVFVSLRHSMRIGIPRAAQLSGRVQRPHAMHRFLPTTRPFRAHHRRERLGCGEHKITSHIPSPRPITDPTEDDRLVENIPYGDGSMMTMRPPTSRPSDRHDVFRRDSSADGSTVRTHDAGDHDDGQVKIRSRSWTPEMRTPRRT